MVNLNNNKANPVDAAKRAVCDRIGANIYGRLDVFLRRAEEGDDKEARRELLALLKFFPAVRT